VIKKCLLICFLFSSMQAITYDQCNVKVDANSKRVSYIDHMKDHLGFKTFEDLFKMVCRLKVERDEAHKVLDSFVSELENVSYRQPLKSVAFLAQNEEVTELLERMGQEQQLVKDGVEIDFLLDMHEMLRKVKETLEIDRSSNIVEEVLRLKMEVLEARLLFDHLVNFTKEGTKYNTTTL